MQCFLNQISAQKNMIFVEIDLYHLQLVLFFLIFSLLKGESGIVEYNTLIHLFQQIITILHMGLINSKFLLALK